MNREPSVVKSPCTNVCRMHGATGWCEGCARSIAEIASWSGLDDEGKRAVLAQLPARRDVLKQQHGVDDGSRSRETI